MPITLINYASGEVVIEAGDGQSVRLPRERANRMVMHARMHAAAEFAEALPTFIEDSAICDALRTRYGALATSTERWNFKEAFARLHTLTKEAPAGDPAVVVESVPL